MAQEIREKLRKERGIPIYIYKADDFTLLYKFESKQHMYDSISIHHKTLNDCLNLGIVYLDTFFFSLDLIEESTKINMHTLLKVFVFGFVNCYYLTFYYYYKKSSSE
jgi:hypothetical protein